MTDSPTPAEPGPVDPDVELASAHLDGEAGPDERGRVHEAAVAAHLAAFQDVSGRVRDVSPPPVGLLDDQVARAMAAFDEGGTVVPMGHPTAGGPAWWQRIPLGAVAAVLVVVALIGAIGLLAQGADDGDDTATAALDQADDSGEAGAGSGATEDSLATTMDSDAAMEADSAPGGATAERPAYADYEQLAGGLREELVTPMPTTTPEEGDEEGDDGGGTESTERGAGADASDPCGAVAVLGLDAPDVVLVRSVLVGPDEVTAVVHDAPDGRRLGVVDDATCSVVLDRLL